MSIKTKPSDEFWEDLIAIGEGESTAKLIKKMSNMFRLFPDTEYVKKKKVNWEKAYIDHLRF